jgi:hypothetical protein
MDVGKESGLRFGAGIILQGPENYNTQARTAAVGRSEKDIRKKPERKIPIPKGLL